MNAQSLGTIASLCISVFAVWIALNESRQNRRRELKAETERRNKAQAIPTFSNADGNPEPLLIGGRQFTTLFNIYGNVQIQNNSDRPITLIPLRLMIEQADSFYSGCYCTLKDRIPHGRLDNVTIKANEVESYELHFLFQPAVAPQQNKEGELFKSTNRDDPFCVKVLFT